MARTTRKPTKAYCWVDTERSCEIASQFECEDRRCWQNAVKILRTPEFHLERATYVEGIYVTTDIDEGGDIPIPHGWLELPDGSIIDPTFAAYPEFRWGTHWYAEGEAHLYIPLAKYSADFLMKIRIEDLPIIKCAEQFFMQ